MSFQPPSSPQPGSPYPSSTPIPSTTPEPARAPAPAFGAPFGAGHAPPPGASFGQPTAYTPLPPQRGRGRGATLFTILVFALPLIGLGIGVFIYLQCRHDADVTRQQVIDRIDAIPVPTFVLPVVPTVPVITSPDVSIPVIVVPTLPGSQPTVPGQVPPPVAPVPPTVAPVPPVTNLWTPDGITTVTGAYETAISGDPSRFMSLSIYADYAFADAQDAAAPTHVDEYPWRAGVVGTSDPVQLIGDGDLEASLFSLADVDVTQIPRLVAEAPGQTTVEQPEVVYVRIERSPFIDGAPLTIKVYVDGPRGSAYVEYDAAGTLIQVVQ